MITKKKEGNKMVKIDEILKLSRLLNENDIPHALYSMPQSEGWQIILYSDTRRRIKLDDAIISKYSFGHEKGLLETYSLNECAGYETAEEVFEGWKKMRDKYLQDNPFIT